MGLNSRDQNKWDSLQDEGGSSIDNILKGKGTDKDYKELSRVLNQQHQLAGQIFDNGLTDAETTAATIVDKLNQDRQDAGKRPLTQKAFDRVFNVTLSNVMSQALEDILGTIHDEFENQDESIKKRLDKAFERVRNFSLPEPAMRPEGPTVPAGQAEPASLMDRFTRRNGHAPEAATPQRRSLMDRLMRRSDQSAATRTSVLQMIKDAAVSAKDKVTSMWDRFRNRGDDDEEKRASVWMRKLKTIFDPIRSAWSKTKKAGSKIGDILGMIGKPLLLALMNPQLIKSIMAAVATYLNFDTISKFVSETWASTKKLGSDSVDWIVDKVKSFFGLGSDKKKPEAKAVPRVDPLKQNTNTGTLPRSISAAQAKQELPKYETGLEQAKKQLTAAQQRYQAQPTPGNKKAVDDAQRNLSFFQTRVTQYSQRAGESKTAGSNPDSATSFVSPGQPTQGGNNAADAGVNAPKTSTSVTGPDPSAVMAGSSVPRTEIVADMPKFTPGKAVDANPGQTTETDKETKSGGGTAQIGMGSFGFDSNDSALNILNLGMIA